MTVLSSFLSFIVILALWSACGVVGDKDDSNSSDAPAENKDATDSGEDDTGTDTGETDTADSGNTDGASDSGNGDSSLPTDDIAPETAPIAAFGILGEETNVILEYRDQNLDAATACAATDLSNVSESTSCSCDADGVCTIGLTGSEKFAGTATLSYTVTANEKTSNASTITMTIRLPDAATNEEWVRVPDNAGGMGLSTFYVMKYEAKAWNDDNEDNTIDSGEMVATGESVDLATHLPASTPSDQPWRSIDADDAAAECESRGDDYHIISNEEWIAIAREIENQAANWTSGIVGTECLFTGNSGDTTCGYDASTDPDSGDDRNARAKHTLSNGETIFDFSGNIFEFTDFDKDTTGFQIGPTSCTASGELPVVVCGAFNADDYQTDNGLYTTAQGVGYFSGGPGGAIIRGGDNDDGNQSGVFAIALNLAPTATFSNVGFRCVYRPQ